MTRELDDRREEEAEEQRRRKEDLRALMYGAIAGRPWSDIEKSIPSKEDDGKPIVSIHTLQLRRDGHRGVEEGMIRETARALLQDPDEWCRKILNTKTASSVAGGSVYGWFHTTEWILNQHDALKEGDEAWLIHCRVLDSPTTKALEGSITKNLKRGVVYKCYYPSPSGESLYSNDAYRSYKEFRLTRLHGTEFERTPRIFGFGVDCNRFPFFSKLHALAYHQRKDGEGDRGHMYASIDPDIGHLKTPNGGHWYRLRRRDMDDIMHCLNNAAEPMADMGLGYKEFKCQLSQLKKAYKDFFNTSNMRPIYNKVNSLTPHREKASREISELLNNVYESDEVKTLNYLDIGCGDGETTECLLAKLKDAGFEVRGYAIDTSEECIAEATERLRKYNITCVCEKFEKFVPPDDLEFHLVTAVHSFYVINEIYVRKVYELLIAGGVAAIWAGKLQGNVFHKMASALDKHLRGNDIRNYAERLEETIRHMLPSVPQPRVIEGHVNKLVNGNTLNKGGRTVAAYFALCPEPELDVDLAKIARDAAASCTRDIGGGQTVHPLDDMLIHFEKEDG